MKPSELIVLLTQTIAARLPVLITGAPGIGKSDLVAQAAAAAGADTIVSHPAVSDPTDVKGLPWVSADAQSATFLPFGELARAIAADRPTVWFLDDLGQATAAVQASFMQLLLARRVNGHALPDSVTFIAATNRRTDRAGVSGILEPVKSRFAAIVELQADIQDWSAWAVRANMAPELIAFLRFRPDLLSAFQPSADLVNSPSPRSWSFVSRLLSLQLPDPILHAAIVGAVGEGAAVEFAAFRRMLRDLPTIDSILIDPDAAPIPVAPSSLYAIATGLAMRANAQTMSRIGRYAARLCDRQQAEFAVLMLRDAIRRDAAIQQTPAFVTLMSGPIGQLISGIAE